MANPSHFLSVPVKKAFDVPLTTPIKNFIKSGVSSKWSGEETENIIANRNYFCFNFKTMPKIDPKVTNFLSYPQSRKISVFLKINPVCFSYSKYKVSNSESHRPKGRCDSRIPFANILIITNLKNFLEY